MSALHVSMVFTVLATLCQGLAIFLPGWSRFALLIGEVQIGIWYSCFNWTACDHYFHFDQFKDLLGKLFASTGLTDLIIQPLIVMATETLAFLLLVVSTVTCAMALCARKRTKLTKTHLGLNVASCFIIMCGILSALAVNGEFKLVNSFGALSNLLKLNFKVDYYYGFYLAVVAAIMSLFSGILCCCISDDEGQSSQHVGYVYPTAKQYNEYAQPNDHHKRSYQY